MRAVIVTGPLVQDQELVYPYYRLQEAGYEVDLAAPELGIFHGIQGVKFEATKLIHEVKAHDYDLLVIPGGVKAMERLRLIPAAVRLVKDFHASGKVVASVCSGAQMLISAGLCKGRVISGYPALQVDIENAGAEFRNAATSYDRIVTAPHYRDLGEWMKMVFMTISAEQYRVLPYA